jgi:hypothetical protein
MALEAHSSHSSICSAQRSISSSGTGRKYGLAGECSAPPATVLVDRMVCQPEMGPPWDPSLESRRLVGDARELHLVRGERGGSIFIAVKLCQQEGRCEVIG